jgi:integrase
MAKDSKKILKGVSCVTRKGEAYWYARIGGGKTYCGKGDKGFQLATAAKAKDLAKGYEHKEIRAGLKVQRPEFHTVKDLLNWYMTEIPSVQAKKGYYRKTVACGHLVQHIGDRSVGDMEEIVQEAYRQVRKSEGAASKTIDVEIATLGAAYNTARRSKKIPAEFVPGRMLILKETNPRRTVTEAEFQKLLDAADPDFRDVLVCGYESAMRSSEICGLTAGQVKLNIHHISGATVDFIDLGIFDTKTKARRTVPVSAGLKEILERRLVGLGPEDRVFTDKGRRLSKFNVSDKMEALCTKAGVPYGDKLLNAKGEKAGIVFHSLRHTRTSKWVEGGFSDEVIRRATGHRSLQAYQTYVKLDPSVVMRLVETKTAKNGTKTTETRANKG